MKDSFLAPTSKNLIVIVKLPSIFKHNNYTYFPSLKYVLRVSLKLLEYFTNSFFWCSRALIRRNKRHKHVIVRQGNVLTVYRCVFVCLCGSLTLRFWYWYFLMTLLTVSRSSFMALAMSLLVTKGNNNKNKAKSTGRVTVSDVCTAKVNICTSLFLMNDFLNVY